MALSGQHRKFVIIGFDGNYHVVVGLITNFNYPDRLLLSHTLYHTRLNCATNWSDERVLTWTLEQAGLMPEQVIPRVLPPHSKPFDDLL